MGMLLKHQMEQKLSTNFSPMLKKKTQPIELDRESQLLN